MRGEYNTTIDSRRSNKGSPPLARGVLDHCNERATLVRITPACAGSTSNGFMVSTAIQDHPRLRGEYMFIILIRLLNQGSPPLARGVRLNITFYGNRKGSPPLARGVRLNITFYGNRKGSPPLARGVPAPRQTHGTPTRITPACAGST